LPPPPRSLMLLRLAVLCQLTLSCCCICATAFVNHTGCSRRLWRTWASPCLTSRRRSATKRDTASNQ
jgi:hypothetical protein